MPDIAMCSHATCELRELCLRHEASGTVPSPRRQAYGDYEPGLSGCRGFINRRRLHAIMDETPERHRAIAARFASPMPSGHTDGDTE
jgi:hypothetical protein